MGWLDNQVAVLTGGGSGLGRALVDTLLEEGARVVVLEYSAEKSEQLRSECDPERVIVVQGDASSFDSNKAAVDAAVQAWGKLDTFIANAGLWDANRGVEAMTPEQIEAGFDDIFRLNVKAPLIGMKAAVDALRASNGSFVVSLSNSALYPGGGGPLYIASKHAGMGLVKQLAYELAPDVRVNGVAPAGMVTDLRGPTSMGLEGAVFADAEASARTVAAKSALHRCPDPVDYTGAYVLLASRRYGITTSGSVLDIANAKGLIGRVADDLLAAR
ncbi:SDR family NAD(P)-dependent oxidoreductase [Luteococcus sp. Sow4_B9]|uniref:SDR family NAD(P)-dependent oxidoreductase n=1 Tax=Luteococcus sp. Sow4_B9 TaxID=3438792 RepID=UPI003F9A9EB8